MEEELRKFVINSNQIEENVERIFDFKCERLFQDYLILHAPYLSTQIENVNAKQKIKNELFQSEIINLATAFSKENLILINLKGISLLNELYPQDETTYKKRKINDIDILVSPEKLAPSLNLLGRLGYFVGATNEIVSSGIIPKYIGEVVDRGIHFPEFYKQVYHNDKLYKIKMDCHISILHFMNDKEIKMQEIINRYETQYLNGNPICVLEIHDRLLHLITHFTKENFRCDVRWYVTGERQFIRDDRIRLPLLYEIALMISKNQIDWNILIKRAQSLGCQDEVKLTMSLLERIYPDLVNYNLFRDLEVSKSDFFFWEKYSGLFYPLELQYMDAYQILDSKLSEKSHALMSTLTSNTELEINKVYDISYCETDQRIDRCILSIKEQNSYGEICFSIIKEDFNILLKGDKLLEAGEIYFTFGNAKKSNVLSAYVSKMSLVTSSVSSYGECDCEFHNGYVDLKLKRNAKFNYEENTISISVPLEILGITKESEYILFDIGLPSLYPAESSKIKLYNINDISQRGLGQVFSHSPRLLSRIKLI